MPRPADTLFELWPVSKQSVRLSPRFGKPDMPSSFRSVSKLFFRPVRILWT